MTDLLQELRTLLASETGVDRPLRLEDELLRDLQLDSLQLMSLVVRLEDHFRVALDETDEPVRTVGDLVALLSRLLGEGEREAAP